jgi:hypothetical protein
MFYLPSSNARAESLALFSILNSLHQWEVEQTELLRSVTGRHLYFSVGQRALVSGMSPTVKEVITTNHLTDRALRMRLQQLVAQGMLKPVLGTGDARTRSLQPTEAFENLMLSHLDTFRRLVNNQFLMIEKENVNTMVAAPAKNNPHNGA